MFNTVTELHIAIDLGLQHISSNRKQSIPKELKDMVLNMAYLNHIDSIIDDRRNNRREGFEENQLNYDSLQYLKQLVRIPLYILDNSKTYGILPNNYKDYSSSQIELIYNKKAVTFTTATTKNYIHQIPIDIGEPNNDGLYLNDFAIWTYDAEADEINNIYTKPEYIKLWEPDSLFILIHDILETLRLKGLEVYWEYYTDIYVPNNLIFISNIEYSKIGFADPIVNKATIKEINQINPIVTDTIRYKPGDLIKSIELHNAQNNYFYSSNRHNKPFVEIRENKIIVHHDNTFIPTAINMTYIKTPRLINSNTGAMCEGRVNEKIVANAIQMLKAYIKDEGYNLILNENKQI